MNNDLRNDILSCGIEHPARTMEFDVLKEGLFSEVDKGMVNVTYHPNYPKLAIFKYSQNCVTERKWNLFSLMARGLILDLENEVVVATPFIKFFNYGELEESGCSFVDSNFIVTEKVDGSLGIIYHYDGKWRVATCGSFQSEQAQWAEKWLNNSEIPSHMDIKNTYLAEIVYPENKVVVSYDYEGLVLLAVYDSYGLEYTPDLLKSESQYLGLKMAKVYQFETLDEILALAKTLSHNEEGFVVKFGNGVRLKIKGDEYVRIHRLISRVTPLAVWESLLNGDDLDSIKKDLPEELEKDFDQIVSILRKKLEVFVEEVEIMHSNTKNMSDRDLGLYMYTKPEAFAGGEFEEAKRYIFMLRKGKFHSALKDHASKARRNIFNAFKPKANVLPGYVPSSAINRFSEG